MLQTLDDVSPNCELMESIGFFLSWIIVFVPDEIGSGKVWMVDISDQKGRIRRWI